VKRLSCLCMLTISETGKKPSITIWRREKDENTTSRLVEVLRWIKVS